jgi:hypothetical protein
VPLRLPAVEKGWQGQEPVQTGRPGGQPARRRASDQVPIPGEEMTFLEAFNGMGSNPFNVSVVDHSSGQVAGADEVAQPIDGIRTVVVVEDWRRQYTGSIITVSSRTGG